MPIYKNKEIAIAIQDFQQINQDIRTMKRLMDDSTMTQSEMLNALKLLIVRTNARIERVAEISFKKG